MKKYILAAAVLLLVLIIILVFSFVISDDIKITEYHPFKSQEARQKYFDANAKASRYWPVPYDSIYADTSYGKIYVRVSGPKNAKPLVLLPGKGGNSLMWYRNAKALSHKYRIYAVDPIFEYGLSVYTKTMKTPDEIIEWLDELFAALNPGGKINLMGLSYGGWLTALYALHYPERVEKAILVAPASTILPMNPQFYFRGLLMTVLPFRYFKESFFLWLLEDVAIQGKEGRQFVENSVDGDEFDAKLFKTMPIPVMPTVFTDEELGNFKMPVLFIAGKNEKIYSAEEAVQRIEKTAPSIKTKIIADAGHGIIFSQSKLINEAVINFLQ
ncbi:MAG: alpha/beta hydrolase [Spirochaetes bacterium]|nr:alpha/beta hydrolase [Spirochaetota bacterium]